jgi:hypothetical protein
MCVAPESAVSAANIAVLQSMNKIQGIQNSL